MKNISPLNLITALTIAGVSLMAPFYATADDSAKASLRHEKQGNLNDTESTVKRAAEVYGAVVNGTHGKVPSSVLQKSKCIAVFPGVITAAIGVGGSHGDGVAFCRSNDSKAWSNPMFLDLTGGSLGIQAGGKSQDIVLYISNETAIKGLQDGNLSLTGELSAVAGKFDESFAIPQAGVVAYTHTSGAFAGASIGAVNISRDTDEQRAFYGTETDSMFEGTIPPSVKNSVDALRHMLPA